MATENKSKTLFCEAAFKLTEWLVWPCCVRPKKKSVFFVCVCVCHDMEKKTLFNSCGFPKDLRLP